MTIVSLSGVSVRFGADVLLADVGFSVGRGERWGVVGRNGSGKTTLFRLLLGEQEPTTGSVFVAPGLRVTVLEQHRDFGVAATVWEAAAGPFADLLALEQSLAEQAHALGGGDPAALERYGHDLERFEREGGYAVAARVDAVLHGLGFDPEAARHTPVAALSGGERGRLGLARQLAAPADLLLLDEPTNHLDLETTRWLEGHLRGLDCAVLLISHDRAFLDAIVDHVLHLEGGAATAYTGGYAAFVRQRADRRLAGQRAYDQQRRQIAATEDFIRRNIAGGNSTQARGRRRRLAALPRLSPPPGAAGAMDIAFAEPERGGDLVLALDGVGVAAGGRTLLRDFTATVRRGEVVGLVGPNGAGKTTLLRALLGERPAAEGTVRLGEGVRTAWYRQDLAQVPAEATVYDAIAELRPAWNRGAIQNHLGAYGFSGDTVFRRCRLLSGGEQARVALAMMVLERANFLIFDEPTNHLDVESIEALEDAIAAFEGTVLLVSHDRALLESLVERVWVLHAGRITDWPGSFAEWEERSRERAHAAAVAAAEEESSRRLRERQRVRRQAERDRSASGATRAARMRVERAEFAVAGAEQRVEELRRRLEDPALYATADGGREAAALGAALEAARRDLEAAFAGWEAAVEALEAEVGR
ncbi:MAG TPA: ABC-F family ATP-binding cassette domain-containing protein [Gemmatimonadales bacterium]|nr:ABC-F family ATP-binding cassette domain-containing protein [Gemmatimonadales bacterium]